MLPEATHINLEDSGDPNERCSESGSKDMSNENKKKESLSRIKERNSNSSSTTTFYPEFLTRPIHKCAKRTMQAVLIVKQSHKGKMYIDDVEIIAKLMCVDIWCTWCDETPEKDFSSVQN